MSAADPSQDLEVAERALASGEAGHAVHHLCGAVATAPFDERVHAVFEKLSQSVDVLSHLPDNGFVGTHLVRAWAQRRAGRVDEAAGLLAQIADFQRDRGFESLLASWLIALRAEGRRLGPEASTQVARLLAQVGEGTVGLNRLWPGEQALLSGYGDLAAALVACSSHPLAGPVAMGMLRRTGRFTEAMEVPLPEAGERAAREFTFTQRGLVLRAMGEPRRAAEAFASSAELAPDDRSLRIEQARCWFVAGDDEQALAHLTPALVEGDDECQALASLARSHPGGDRLRQLDGVRRESLDSSLRLPGDATANLFQGHRAELAPGASKVNAAVSGWESPSNRLLVALFSAGTTQVELAPYTMSAANLPFDPWRSRRGATHPLWAGEPGALRQAVPPPDDELRSAVGRLAIAPVGLASLWDAAAELASGWPAERAPEIAAALVHPPTDRAFLEALPGSLYRHQVAGACVLANLPDGWATALPVLESMLFGPVDWVGAAAIVALGERARRDAERAPAIRALLCSAVGDLMPHSAEPRFLPLAQALRLIPATPREALGRLDAWYREHLADEESPDGAGEAEHDDDAPTSSAAPASALPPAADVASVASTSGDHPWIWRAALGAAAVVGALALLAHACG